MDEENNITEKMINKASAIPDSQEKEVVHSSEIERKKESSRELTNLLFKDDTKS